MPQIDPTSRVADGAKLADDVEVGPFCIIGPKVELRAGVRLLSHVNLAGVTVIGEQTVVYPFASLGTPPQSTGYRGGATRLNIGRNCQIREGVTISTGTEDHGEVTTVGDRCFLMANSHVGHDCHVGNDVIFANGAVLGGHVSIAENVFLGGNTAVHQFVRIGEGAMMGGISGITRDVIPFGFAFGPKADPGRIQYRRTQAARVQPRRYPSYSQSLPMLFFGEARSRSAWNARGISPAIRSSAKLWRSSATVARGPMKPASGGNADSDAAT